MMKIVNRKGLPQAIVNAVTNDPYDNKGTLSVTRLLAPAFQRRLMSQHWDDIEEDVEDRIWALLGQSTHAVIERAAGPGDIVEQRVFCDVDGHKLSGQLDHLSQDGVLTDYKLTSVWSVKAGLKPEWEAQLNMLDYLISVGNLNQHMPSITDLQIIAICRDWNKSGSMRDPDYPDKVVVMKVPRWHAPDQLEYIQSRIKAHTQDDPKPCDDEERWFRPGKSAVMKRGRKSALRLLDSESEAKQYMVDNGYVGSSYYIENRPGVYPRCQDYCSVNLYCPVWQEHLAKLAEEME